MSKPSIRSCIDVASSTGFDDPSRAISDKQRHRLHPRARRSRRMSVPRRLDNSSPFGPVSSEWCAEIRRRAAHRLHDLDLRRGVGDMIRPAHDRGHAHVDIIHRRGKGIKDLPIRPDQHRIGHRGRVNRDRPEDAVVSIRSAADPAGSANSPHGLLRALWPFRPRSCAATRGHRPAACACSAASCASGPTRPATRSIHRTDPRAQLIRGLAVAIKPQRLLFDPVPMQAQPFQIEAAARQYIPASSVPDRYHPAAE